MPCSLLLPFLRLLGLLSPAAVVADGATAFGEWCLNQLNKGGRCGEEMGESHSK